MSSKQPIQRLADIVENIQAIAEFTAGMRYEDYIHDRKTIYAVTRALEIISEASRRLSDAFKQSHPEIDWTGLAAVGREPIAGPRSCPERLRRMGASGSRLTTPEDARQNGR